MYVYKIQMLQQIAHEITEEKKNLLFEGSNSDFFIQDNYLKDKAKLLKEKFDNIIEIKHKEKTVVSAQLQHIENQRKLAIYNR